MDKILEEKLDYIESNKDRIDRLVSLCNWYILIAYQFEDEEVKDIIKGFIHLKALRWVANHKREICEDIEMKGNEMERNTNRRPYEILSVKTSERDEKKQRVFTHAKSLEDTINRQEEFYYTYADVGKSYARTANIKSDLTGICGNLLKAGRKVQR